MNENELLARDLQNSFIVIGIVFVAVVCLIFGIGHFIENKRKKLKRFIKEEIQKARVILKDIEHLVNTSSYKNDLISFLADDKTTRHCCNSRFSNTISLTTNLPDGENGESISTLNYNLELLVKYNRDLQSIHDIVLSKIELYDSTKFKIKVNDLISNINKKG